MAELVLKKTKTEQVCPHFCDYCNKKVMAKGGNTFNLHAHLRKYASIPAQMGPKAKGRPSLKPSTTQLSIEGSFIKSSKYKRNSTRWKECTKAVTTYIAKGMVSFNTVEKQSFKMLFKTVNCWYGLTAQKYFSEVAIPEMYNKLRSEVQVLMSEGHYFALTADM